LKLNWGKAPIRILRGHYGNKIHFKKESICVQIGAKEGFQLEYNFTWLEFGDFQGTTVVCGLDYDSPDYFGLSHEEAEEWGKGISKLIGRK
jgi:hypothetical protein